MNLSQKNWQVLFFIALIALSAFFSFYRLSDSPAIWYDEGFYTQVAMNVATGHGFNLQIAPSQFVPATAVTVGYPLIYPVALAYKLFGVGVLQGRFVMAIFLILFTAASFVFVKKVFGFKTAVLCSLLLVSFSVLYGNGKSVLGEVPGMFFFVLFLIALYHFERSSLQNQKNRVLVLLFLGLFLGLCAVIKPVYLVAVFALILGWLIVRPSISVKEISILVVSFVAPVVIWFFTQLHGVASTRTIQTLVSFYANPYESGHIGELLLVNIKRFLTEGAPAYLALLTIIWFSSLVIRYRAQKIKNIALTEITAFIFHLGIIAAFMRTPGWYRYFFQAQIVVYLFLPQALFILAETMVNAFSGLKKRISPILIKQAVAFLCILIVLGQLYHLSFNSWVASYYKSDKTEVLNNYFSHFDHAKSIFVYNVPEMVILLKTNIYYQFIQPHPDQVFGKEQLDQISKKIPDFIIINEETYYRKPLPPSYKIKNKISHYLVLSHE